jgi:hypothetical protein
MPQTEHPHRWRIESLPVGSAGPSRCVHEAKINARKRWN